MKKRKLIAAVLVLALLLGPVVVYSQAVPAVAIWGVSTAGAAWTAAGEWAVAVRAALAAPAFYSAATWVTSTLAPAAASLVVPMACVAGAGIAGYAAAWAALHGWEYIEGKFWGNDTAAALAAMPGQGSTSWSPQYDGYTRTYHAAPFATEAEAIAWVQANAVTYQGQLACSGSVVFPGSNGWDCSKWIAYSGYTQVNLVVTGWWGMVPIGGVTGGTTVEIPTSTVQSTLVTDLTGSAADLKAAAKALVEASAAMVIAAENLAKKSNTWPPAAMPGQNPIPQSQWDAWENALKAGISNTDKTAMGAQDTTANYGLDASNPPIALVGPLDAGLTEEQVKNAVRDGIEEAEEDLQPPELPGTPPLGTDPDPPDKLSLTAILEEYTDNLETLPIVGIVSGAHLEIEGADPVLDLPVTIPPNPPVNVRIDFSKYESIVDTLGTLMLTYVSIIWTVWLFKGRGDA